MNTNASTTVAVLGASSKPDRYANRAVRMLLEHGYRVLPVHPRETEVEGLPVLRSLDEIREPVHTLTVYVAPARLLRQMDEIEALQPGRVILNPGTESDEVFAELERRRIPYEEACTLVLLGSGSF